MLPDLKNRIRVVDLLCDYQANKVVDDKTGIF